MSGAFRFRLAGAATALSMLLAMPASHAASAVPSASLDSRALLDKIVQCRASYDELAEFNDRVDQHRVKLREAKAQDLAPGPAWTVTPPLTTLGVKSSTVVLNSRSTVLLIVPSAHPYNDVLALVPGNGMEIELKMGTDAIVRKDIDDRALRAFTVDKTHYAAGCVYDERRMLLARAARYNASPERQAEKKALERALDQ
ncbi:hypothetical protein [Burkholderia sp. 3C]